MRTFKLLTAFVFTLCLLAFVGCSKEELQNSAGESAEAENSAKISESVDFKAANNGPKGAHYNLNIIGVPKDKTASMTGNNGHRIFMPLHRKSKIMLIEGDDYKVLDANGTDGSASFQLPNPDPDGDNITSYSIWMRALGKPGGKAIITTCADADLTDDYYEVCSAEYLEVERQKGKPRFENVSKTMLTIHIEEDITFTDGDGVEQTVKAGRYTIFDEAFEDYFWEYDNNGLKLLQLRFYEVGTDIS